MHNSLNTHSLARRADGFVQRNRILCSPSPIAALLATLALMFVVTGCAAGQSSTDNSAPVAVFTGEPLVRVTVFSVPSRYTWEQLVKDCDRGVQAPGDVALVDERTVELPPNTSPEGTQVRLEFLDGRNLVWEGGIQLMSNSNMVLGLLAARELVRPSRSSPQDSVGVVAAAGWYDEAVRMAADAWSAARLPENGARYRISDYLLLRRTMEALPEAWQRQLVDRWVAEAIAGLKGDALVGWPKSRARRERQAKLELSLLAQHGPKGISAVPLLRAMREAGLGKGDEYLYVVRQARDDLVLAGAYHEAVDGDEDPVGQFFEDEFWRGLAVGVMSLVPLPVPYATTSEESNAVKKQAIKDMEIEYCDKGVRLYEALVATGRGKEAERMQTRLRSHFPGERLEAELIKARERASATTTVDERVHR